MVAELDCLSDEMVRVSTLERFSSESWMVGAERWALPSKLMELYVTTTVTALGPQER